MTYLPTLLILAALTASPVLLAEDADTSATTSEESNNASALTALCNTYAEEDDISESKKAAYLKECMNSMTDLSESMQEGLPATAETSGEALALPSSVQANNSPEKLVQNELVESPDPAAEQLTAEK